MEITTIGGAIVLALMIIGVFCYYKFCIPKDSDRKAANNFIKGYKNVFENTIEKIIDDIDISNYHTIEELESDIFNIAYEECWDYTEKALQEALSNSTIGSLIAKCVTKENVEELVRKMIEVSFLQKVAVKYEAVISKNVQDMIEEDNAKQIEADLYETGKKEVEPYIETEQVDSDVHLNPQRDEEEPFSNDDISQEIIED